ncbi:hypothetical protein ACJX0J_011785, partial [Zea mays]
QSEGSDKSNTNHVSLIICFQRCLRNSLHLLHIELICEAYKIILFQIVLSILAYYIIFRIENSFILLEALTI